MATEQKAIVVSGDVVGSSLLKPAARKKLQQLLDAFFEQAVKQWSDLHVQQYRGDSIQGVFTTNRLAALRFVLLLQSYLGKEKYKMRLSVGVGDITFKSKSVVTSDGTAFQVSGLNLDAITKSGELIIIAGADDDFTSEW